MNVLSAPNKALERSFVDIATEIRHLNKISNIIRRASKEDHNSKAKDFQIRDDEGNNVEQELLGHFRRHIRDRFPKISDTIQQRLASAMVLRRKRILYRRHRQGNMAIRPQETVPEASVTLPSTPMNPLSVQRRTQRDKVPAAVVAPAIFAPSRIESATTLATEKYKKAASTPSVVSASNTVALGSHDTLIFPPAPGFAAKRKYERLKSKRLAIHQDALDRLAESPATADSSQDILINRNASGMTSEQIASAEAEIKDILKSDLQAVGEIMCPYCLYALPAELVFDERKWQ